MKVDCWFFAVALPFLVTATVLAQSSPDEPRLFPGVASRSGVNGTRWRTEVLLYSPGASATALLELIPRGVRSPVAVRAVNVPGSIPIHIEDLYAELGADEGVGMLRLSGGASAWVRTFNLSEVGTYGQEVPGVPVSAGIPAHTKVFVPFSTPADLLAEFRSNLLLVNFETASIDVRVSAGGVTRTVHIPPVTYIQIDGLGGWLGSVPGWAVAALSADGRFWATVSTIDPATGDPTTVLPRSVSVIPAVQKFSGVGGNAGVNGTQWRSDVTLFNPGETDLEVSLEVVQGGVVTPGHVTLGPGQVRRIEDLYAELGAPAYEGSLWVVGGALTWVRTYNLSDRGTYGQDVADAASEEIPATQFALLPVARSAERARGFRSNLLLTNLEIGLITCDMVATNIHWTTDLWSGYRSIHDVGPLFLPAPGFGAVAIAAGGRWSATVSLIDGTTGDPTTFRALPFGPTHLPPQAADDEATTTAGTAVTIDVLANDFDPEGGALSLWTLSAPSHGTVSTSSDGTAVVYTPLVGFTGFDTFTYEVRDPENLSARASVTVAVQAPAGPELVR